jgi:hypothetical protein
VDASSQRQSVADYVAVGTAVGTKVGSLQCCGGVAAGDSAFAGVGVQQGSAKCRLAAAGDDVPVGAQAGVIIVSRKLLRVGALLGL